MIKLYSSHGEIAFNADGYVVLDELDPQTFPPENHPFKLDLKEFQARYPGEAVEGDWDILDWSYWTITGFYEKEVTTQIQEEGLHN